MDKVYILHIGKTGGSAVQFVIRQHLKRHPDTPVALVGHRFSIPKIEARFPGSRFGFFVRDPISRYVSSFNSRLRQGRPRYVRPWTERERKAFARFPRPTELAEALSSDHEETRLAAEAAMSSIKHVNQPLTHFLGGPSYLEERKDRIAFIGDQATFDADFAAMRMMLGVDPDIGLPDATMAHRAPNTDDRNLSEVAKANLRRWYADDYSVYEWCVAWRESRRGQAAA